MVFFSVQMALVFLLLVFILLFPLWLFWLNWCLLYSNLLIICLHVAKFRGLNAYYVPIVQLFINFFQYALSLQWFQRISLKLSLMSSNLLRVALQVFFLVILIPYFLAWHFGKVKWKLQNGEKSKQDSNYLLCMLMWSILSWVFRRLMLIQKYVGLQFFFSRNCLVAASICSIQILYHLFFFGVTKNEISWNSV